MADIYINSSTGSNSNGGTNDGDAYLTLQYAVDNGNAGDTFYMSGTFSEKVTFNTGFTGTLSAALPIKFSGYGGTTLNTGTGTVTGAIWDGSSQTHSAPVDHGTGTMNYITFEKIKFQDFSTYIRTEGFCIFSQVEFDGMGSYCIYDTNGVTYVTDSYFSGTTGAGAYGIYCSFGSKIYSCKFIDIPKPIILTGDYSEVAENKIYGDFSKAIDTQWKKYATIKNNSIEGDNSASQVGVYGLGADHYNINNAFSNLNGASAIGFDNNSATVVRGMVGNNSFYNVATNYNNINVHLSLPDVTESSNPFTDSENGDFSLVSGANSIDAGIGE